MKLFQKIGAGETRQSQVFDLSLTRSDSRAIPGSEDRLNEVKGNVVPLSPFRAIS